MKKLLAPLLGGVILFAGINCTKDRPYRIKNSPNVFFRGEGINVNGEAQSYSKVVEYVINPNKNHRQRNLRRIGGNDGVAYEIWGNTPDGKIIAKVTNLQSCPNDITVRAETDFGLSVSRIKSFTIKGQVDTMQFALDSSKFVMWDAYNSVNCHDFFDPDGLSPVISLIYVDMEQLPMHFKTFDTEGYKVTFTITDLDGADHINIQASLDGITWGTIKVIQAKDIVINQPYSVEVKSPF